MQGGAAFNMTVIGTNFTAACQVQWEGVNKTTWLTSATSLKAGILAGDIASNGTFNVRVLNAAGTEDLVSANKTFIVT